MNKFYLLKKLLLNEKKSLMDSIKKEKDVRDSGTSAMQSWSDTTRNQAERMVVVLEEQLVKVEKLLLEIKKQEGEKPENKVQMWSYVETELDGNKMKIIVVPEGLGGKDINDIRLVSIGSPLGLALVNISEGAKLGYNNKVLEIISVC